MVTCEHDEVSMQASVGGSNGQIVDVFTVIQVTQPSLLFCVSLWRLPPQLTSQRLP